MSETKLGEQRRLQRRTDELKEKHDEMRLDRKPFDKTEHQEHKAALKEHKVDLARHRARPSDED